MLRTHNGTCDKCKTFIYTSNLRQKFLHLRNDGSHVGVDYYYKYCSKCHLHAIASKYLPPNVYEFRITLINKPEYLGFMSDDSANLKIRNIICKDHRYSCNDNNCNTSGFVNYKYFIYEKYAKEYDNHVIVIKSYLTSYPIKTWLMYQLHVTDNFNIFTKFSIHGFNQTDNLEHLCLSYRNHKNLSDAFDNVMNELLVYYKYKDTYVYTSGIKPPLSIQKTDCVYKPLSKYVTCVKKQLFSMHDITFNTTFNPFSLNQICKFYIRNLCIYREIELYQHLSPLIVNEILFDTPK
jgi:hypothetical protein